MNKELAHLQGRAEYAQQLAERIKGELVDVGHTVDPDNEIYSSSSIDPTTRSLIEEALLEIQRIKAGLSSLLDDSADARSRSFPGLIELMPEALILTDEHGLISAANSSAGDLLGMTSDRLIGKPLASFVLAENQAQVYRVLSPSSSESFSHTEPVPLILNAQSGTKRVLASVSQVRDRASAAPRICWLLQDAVGLQRNKAELERLQEALQMQLRKLAEARSQATEAARVKSQFLANMSHEFRTPLNAVLGISEVLTHSGLNAEQTEWAQIIKDSAVTILELVKTLFDLSQMEVGQFKIANADFDITASIEEVISMLAEEARQRNLSLMCYIDPSLPQEMLGDSLRLKQIITNLVANAIKFTDQGEVSLRVMVDRTYRKIRFAVSDTGPGLSQNDINKLFQPFSQVDSSSTRAHNGSGLGLFISKNLVELMGGRIGVFSTGGSGATFWFTLPLEGDESEAAISKKELLKDTAVVVLSNLLYCRNVLSRYFKDWGAACTAARAPEEALAFIAGTDCKIVIVDLDSLGFELADWLQDPHVEEVFTGRQLIVISKDPESMWTKRPMSQEFTYLQKPVKSGRLYEACRVAIEPVVAKPSV